MKVNSSKIRGLKLIGLIISICTLVVVSLGASSLIRVRAAVDRSVITIGDRITYTLIIEHAPGIKIEQPGPGANLGQFEIKDYRIHDVIETDSLLRQQFDYVISVFDTGKFVIPPFPVAFATTDTATRYQLIMSDPIKIQVESVLTAESSDIRDIKPPQPVPLNYRRLILLGTGIFLLLLAVGLTVYILLQRKKGLPLFRKEIVRPAHEKALEALDKLDAEWRPLFEAGEHKLLFTRLSDILRQYFEDRFFVQALEETTSELLQSLRETGLEEEELEQSAQILELSDLAKFAKYAPLETEIENALSTCRQLIETTKLEFAAVEREVEIEPEKAVDAEVG